ncbi:hypothetical protein ABI_41520 [Asticcacaulis biprosthecium C19]|uniref:Uncharacterized protein n=1 Tax=Asticcacaulis biprosthecium C19 TaxID=715226 RepID=F4QSL0_9CAUL|nr:hypothetical protein [Asticcacaulis biprosthecium]EGF89730.1 hypothetical protein ABI_41520 [Asticcacaulis biprosthecium C19]
MRASRFVLALGLMMALPCAALAQASDEVVAAKARTKLPTQAEIAASGADDTIAKPVTTDDQIIAWLNNAPKIEREGRGDGLWSDRDGEGKRKIHGGAGVSIGTGGYRSGYVYTLIPVGDDGLLGLSYSQTDYGTNGNWGYGYDDYPGYGYPGAYGHRYGRGGATSQSFGLSLDMSDGARDASGTPRDCAPGFRVAGAYTEPLWVRNLRADGGCLPGD